MSKQYSTKEGNLMYNQDGNYQQNPNGLWSEAIPLPLYGLKKQCYCGRSFWKEENYRKHYQQVHTDGKEYDRTPTGLIEHKHYYTTAGDSTDATCDGCGTLMQS
jgi:hypothetical protein